MGNPLPTEQAPVFNDELVKKFHKDIDYIIKTKVFNYGSADICYDYQDVYQECLTHLWNATKIYDGSRGMKFRTFAIFHLHSRIGNFRNKVVRKNKNSTIAMSDLPGGWGIAGVEGLNESESEASVSSQYAGFVADLFVGSDAMDEILDAKKVLEQLSGHRRTLFAEYYIKGKKIKEICEDNPGLKYHQVRRHMKYLDKIYKTLIKGETPCLQ